MYSLSLESLWLIHCVSNIEFSVFKEALLLVLSLELTLADCVDSCPLLRKKEKVWNSFLSQSPALSECVEELRIILISYWSRDVLPRSWQMLLLNVMDSWQGTGLKSLRLGLQSPASLSISIVFYPLSPVSRKVITTFHFHSDGAAHLCGISG